MPRRTEIGIVVRDKSDKTRRVEILRRVRHPLYGKYIRQKTVCYVHDENNESGQGDIVEIVESPPRSKTKRWDLVRVVTKSTEVDVTAMRAARKAEEDAKKEAASS